MDFEQFKDLIFTMITEKMEGEADIQMQAFHKNNGLVLTGLMIRGKNQVVAPTLYLEPYYDMYFEGVTCEEIVEKLISQYRSLRIDVDFDFEKLGSFEWAREHVAFKLINYERNEELLQNVPHERFLDLAIVYYCGVENKTFGKATMLITNDHLRTWNVTREEVAEMAKRNTPVLYPHSVRALAEVLHDLASIKVDIPEQELPRIYLFSTKPESYGASVILYERILKDFSEALGCDLVILPSSIYEVLILPLDEVDDLQRYTEMVSEVNREAVEQTEQLSDHVYIYDRACDEVRIA